MQAKAVSTVLLSRDVASARRFYVEALGFEVTFTIEWFCSMRHPSTGALLDLWRFDHESVPQERRQPSRSVIAFMVDDVDREAARLERLGAEVLQPCRSNPWGQRNCLIQGPDEVVIDVLSPIPPDPAWLKANGLG